MSDFPSGKNYAGGIRSQCLDCKRQAGREYFRKHEKEVRARTKQYQIEHPREYWAYSTLCGHRGRGCEILITKKELIDLAYLSDVCQVCDEPLDWGLIGKNGSPLDNSPTLDRTDNESILAIHNVQIICSRCNVTKNARSMEEFIRYCSMVSEKFKE